MIDLGSAQVLGSYAIGINDASRGPLDFEMQGSNDATTWTTVDSRTGITSWTSGALNTYTCATATTAYRYFRLYITQSNGGQYTNVGELYLYQGVAPVPPNSQRGNIAYDQIKATDRTGNGNQLLTWNNTVPATAGAAGNAGQVAYDGTHLYVCVAAHTWVRATLATW
jgi:hypothetical protein